MYAPRRVHVEGARPHPAELVESAAMAAVDPPNAVYTPRLPQRLIREGLLSQAQLESIVYAGQSHEKLLPDGRRRGYFIGDGTGTGKGRQICGIILDHWNQGRTKAVWVSQNKSLIDDARRDWTDLGQPEDELLDLGKIKYQEITAPRGVLFCTYDTLKSQSKTGAGHISQIEKWLGPDFDGVIAFDEAHNMANALDTRSGRSFQKASHKALAGLALQDSFPHARVVYTSATGATDVKDLAYLTRLGLWGKGTAFPDVRAFTSQIASGGLAAMELTARDMKAMGVYIARSISFAGVSYDTLLHELTPMQQEIYDTLSRAWQRVLTQVDAGIRLTQAANDPRARANAYGQFFSAMQGFYNQILTSMSMPSVLADIRRELAQGHSCVLQIVNTNQAAADRGIAAALEEGLDLEQVDLTPSDRLIQYLKTSFPIYQFETYLDQRGNQRARPVMDSEGNRVVNRAAVAQRDALLEEIKQMKTPDGPLEMLLDAFGTEQVAEVTGRTRRLVPAHDGPGRVLEKRTASHAAADVQAFQDGRKRILIFSDAGGTGKSYHADRRAKNQQRRIHYLLQPGWNAGSATQGFGRTHRSNQVCAPVFRLVTTNIMGQKRFITTIARRLDQLGALTKGQRQTGSGIFGQKDNLESPLAKDTLAVFYRALAENHVAGVPDGMAVLHRMGLTQKLTGENGAYQESAVSRDIKTFLNRILVLEVEEQNTVFGAFYHRFTQAFDEAMAEGRIDAGLENFKADRVDVLERSIVRQDRETGTETAYLRMRAYRRPELVEFSGTQSLHENFRGFFRLRDGGIRAVYQIADKTLESGEITARYWLQTPLLHRFSTYMQKTFDAETVPVPREDWAAAWRAETAKAPEFEEDTLHMLTGALLPVWDKLPQQGTRVMRVTASDGQQYLGRLIPENEITRVLSRFGKASAQPALTPDGVWAMLMDKNYRIALDRDHLKLERRRVGGEWRMEISGDNLWWVSKNHAGIFMQTINYQKRFFIPIGEAGHIILRGLLTDYSVQSVFPPQQAAAAIQEEPEWEP